jgi:hypothetical protein
MYREEAVDLMCDTVNETNRYIAGQNGMDSAKIEEFIAQNQEQLKFMNGIIYDALKQNGVIV